MEIYNVLLAYTQKINPEEFKTFWKIQKPLLESCLSKKTSFNLDVALEDSKNRFIAVAESNSEKEIMEDFFQALELDIKEFVRLAEEAAFEKFLKMQLEFNPTENVNAQHIADARRKVEAITKSKLQRNPSSEPESTEDIERMASRLSSGKEREEKAF